MASAGSPAWACVSDFTDSARARDARSSSRLRAWLSGCTEPLNSEGSPDDDRDAGLYAVTMCSVPPGQLRQFDRRVDRLGRGR